jgi:fatty acid desaturase
MSEAVEVEAHPHELRGVVPDRLPASTVRALSVLEPGRAIAAIAVEWVAIAAAIALAEVVKSPWLYPFVVVFIGARQHALTVIGHDAAHFRLLPGRFANDLVGDMFVQWPTFITVDGFRKFHGEHHKFLGGAQDGNRRIWRTHRGDGTLTREWTYPKTWPALALKILLRASMVTGAFWILRGFVASLLFRRTWGHFLLRLAYTGAICAALTLAHAWWGFFVYWIVPFCTWHIAAQYVRLVCEHSGVRSDHPAYAETRTTLARAWERWLIVPRNIHYHIEHHWYPSVPFYKLPALHAALMEQPGFKTHAVVTGSVVESLRQVTSGGAARTRP